MKTEEKLVSLTKEQHEKLRKLAKNEGRTMRGLIEVMIRERETKST